MKNAFVLDCSVTMSWCFQDETNKYPESVLDSLEITKAIVPTLWNLEVSNVLLMAQKRKRITDTGIFHFLSLLEELPIIVTPQDISMNDIILLSQKYQLTSYDAVYLNICLDNDIPLATTDKQLEKAVLNSGGKIYTPCPAPAILKRLP